MRQPTLRRAVLSLVALLGVLPILAGLWQSLRASFGILPALGATTLSPAPWGQLMQLPGLTTSLALTLTTGLGATLIAFVLVVALCAARADRAPVPPRLLAPFLAAPHAAMAIGLAFLIAPSGWIARALAQVLGWSTPPLWITVNDPHGFALILGLVIKEVPFLLLVTLSALSQIPLRQSLITGRALGYGAGALWLKLVLPQIWPLIRLPLMVVLAYALSNVDMALILGPATPPTLAVLLARLFSDPDTAKLLPASAGAILQALLVLASFAALWATARLTGWAGRIWLRKGTRGPHSALGPLPALTATALLALGALSMAALLVWSLAWRWPFPRLAPESWSLSAWDTSTAPLTTTLLLALTTTLLSTLLAVAWLEGEDRARRRTPWAEALIYLPLLVPQISFLYGLNILFLRIGISGGMGAVIWAQTLFVFPYVMLTLSAPWRALDPRLTRTAAALGAGPWRQLIAVKLPALLRPLLTAAAIGVAVSVAQYLPTLFMGAGRIATLTTEAVTLASGSDRRITGATATLQAALPLLAYLIAFALPALVHRNRRALNGGHTAWA
ncbi:ABC transporter permease [Pseudooceanicola spongiae]|uniref:ABC transporter permease subunit n=1 Tax=Pseudooceanicola spongiae TaxID=2613965 RepID=A0A7L9WS72_9RHOB|nr:ABC transporter permease subunit [Pseudooceanicola spongiae]QOL82704.1 ABC transporter permease subunit [Pseudooceanicola spongiae]